MIGRLAMVVSPAVILSCLLVGSARPLVRAQTPTPSEVETFVKQAIEDRFAAKNIPDFNLLDKGPRIAIREEMPFAGKKLTKSALPQREGYEFFLISQADSQAQADASNRHVYFITVDRPAITGDTASISLGVDVTFPSKPAMAKLCCCTGRGEFRRVDGRWTFVKWSEMICA